jgi:hypothetical protein
LQPFLIRYLSMPRLRLAIVKNIGVCPKLFVRSISKKSKCSGKLAVRAEDRPDSGLPPFSLDYAGLSAERYIPMKESSLPTNAS